MYDSLSEALGEEVTPETPAELLRKHAQRVGAEVDPKLGHGKLVEDLWEHLVGDQLYAPTFVRDFPIETSPLTRQHRSIPGVAEKWDLYVRGFELAHRVLRAGRPGRGAGAADRAVTARRRR